mmetsp:Transcript_42677/g.142016  ORF Transcript_42677/g.142016 Transcript_42677/m.142016 type:complete len:241 (+) Transcript_42677:450-1172(+)
MRARSSRTRAGRTRAAGRRCTTRASRPSPSPTSERTRARRTRTARATASLPSSWWCRRWRRAAGRRRSARHATSWTTAGSARCIAWCRRGTCGLRVCCSAPAPMQTCSLRPAATSTHPGNGASSTRRGRWRCYAQASTSRRYTWRWTPRSRARRWSSCCSRTAPIQTCATSRAGPRCTWRSTLRRSGAASTSRCARSCSRTAPTLPSAAARSGWPTAASTPPPPPARLPLLCSSRCSGAE